MRADVLLDDSLLTGPRTLRRYVYPDPRVILVPPDGLEEATQAIRSACERWGGGQDLLLTARAETGEIDHIWRDLIFASLPEAVHRGSLLEHNDSLPRGTISVLGEPGRIEPLLALLARDQSLRDTKPRIQIGLPAEGLSLGEALSGSTRRP